MSGHITIVTNDWLIDLFINEKYSACPYYHIPSLYKDTFASDSKGFSKPSRLSKFEFGFGDLGCQDKTCTQNVK